MTTLKGRITVHGDEPATTATVELRNENGDVMDQVRVDDEGNYKFHLGPGTWSLNLWDAHGHRGSAEVELSQGEDKEVDVDLEEPAGGH